MQKIIQVIRSKTFDIMLVLWTILLGLIIPILLVNGRSELVRRVSRIWSHGIILGLKYVVGLKHQEVGRSNLPKGQVIIACNHQSAWETLVFNVFIPDVCIVLKKSLYKLPVFGWYLKRSPMIAIDREDGREATRILLKQFNIFRRD
ncbi:MAG: hypothetical protein TECD_00343 [Hyphomicrobiaceae bacterium hypho_1]